MKKGRTIVTAGLTAALIVILVAPAMSQVAPVAARTTGAVASMPVEHVDLLVGRSTVIRTDRPIKRVSLPKPEIADALVTSAHEVLVHGKTPGTISLLVWADTGHIRTYDIVVQRDLSALEDRIEQLFPGEPITVSSNGADVVLSGIVSSSYVVDKASSLAMGYVEKKENVVNLLRQDEGLASNQVLLRVRFAEVSRTALQELGASFFTGGAGYKDWIARSTTQQFPAPDFDTKEGGLVFSDYLNILAFNTKEQLGTVVKALQTKGLFQSLAEPNLVTQNGKEASFLAGGEFPYPVVQGGGANASVTIQFKEFGVRLKFTPTITGSDTVHLKVAPEVSALDFANSVTVEGFRVPALSTRRTETEVELRDGQTFAIAGLIDNTANQTMSKIPGIGDIPILGLLFRSRAYQKNATELVVMITPQILRRDSEGVTGHLPRMVTPFIPHEKKTLPPPAPAFSTPEARSVAPVGDSDAADAAAAAPGAPAAPALSKAELKALEKARAEEAAREREAQKAEAERAERERLAQEKAAAVAAEEARKQAEIERKQAAKQAEIDRKNAEKQAELDRKQAEIEKKRLIEEQKRNEEIRKLEEKLERERAKRAAEDAARAKKLEEMRQEAEKKKAEERREEQERLARERAKHEPWPRLRSRI